MGLFDAFKKKKNQKEQPQFVSYSHTTEDGKFMEAYGYSRKDENDVKSFFDNLSEEELNSIKRPYANAPQNNNTPK